MNTEERNKIAKKAIKDGGYWDHDRGFRTFCTVAVLAFFGISKDRFKYLQYTEDVIRAFTREGWQCKIQQSAKGKAVKNLNKFVSPGLYLVALREHVMIGHVAIGGDLNFPVGMICCEYSNARMETVHKISRKTVGTI